MNNFRALSLGIILVCGSAISAKLATHGISQIPSYIVILSIAALPILLLFLNTTDSVRASLIYAAGVATLWNTSLVTSHLWGWDIHYMYNVSRIISETGDIPLQTNIGHGSMVAISWLTAMINVITGLSIVTVYKWVGPVVVAALPLILFLIARRFVIGLPAILAPFGFIFFYRFYKVIPGKQPTAQLLMATIILFMIIDRKPNQRSFFAVIVLGAAMVTAHHSTSLIALLFAAVTVGITLVLNASPLNWSNSASSVYWPVGIIGIFWMIWYLRILSGDVIVTAISAGSFSLEQMHDTIAGILDSSVSASSGGAASRTGSSYFDIILQDTILSMSALLVLLVTGAGVLGVIFYSVETIKTNDTNGFILGHGIAAIGFAGIGLIASVGMGFDRVISYSLLILGLFIPLVPRGIARIGNSLEVGISRSQICVCLAVLISLMFVFGSGFAFVAAGEQPPAYALGVDADSYWQTYEGDEVAAATWVSAHFEETAAYLPPGPINQRDGLLLVERFYREDIVSIEPDESGTECKSFFHTERPWRNGNGPDGWLTPNKNPYFETTLSKKPIIYHSGKGTVYKC